MGCVVCRFMYGDTEITKHIVASEKCIGANEVSPPYCFTQAYTSSNCMYVLKQPFSPKRIIKILKFDSSLLCERNYKVDGSTWIVHKTSVYRLTKLFSYSLKSGWSKITEYDSNGSLTGK